MLFEYFTHEFFIFKHDIVFIEYLFLSPDGYLFDKETILEYILHQKADNSRKMKHFEQYKNKQDKYLKELAEIEAKEKYQKFMKTEGKFVQSDTKDDKIKDNKTAIGKPVIKNIFFLQKIILQFNF